MNMNQNIKLILKTYVLVLSIFSIFRILLFFSEIDLLDFNTVSIYTIIKAFVMGVRFDIVISGYILLLPAIILFVLDIINKNESVVIRKLVFYWIFILFTISFIISSADIPYFNQFYDRFSVGAFKWMESFDFVFSMIIQEPKYFLIIIPFLILNVLFFFYLKKVFRVDKQFKQQKLWLKTTFSLLFLVFMFIGIRGRIQKKSPIRIGTAYFSDNAFLNKLGLNPVFTLMRSYLDSNDPRNALIKIMDEKQAIKKVQKYLNIDTLLYNSPIARKISFDTNSIKPNIVVIIMESMSAAKMKQHGNKYNLTPFLDSLVYNSIYFKNTYTSGKHTYNGVFSTLYSFPALFRQHPMKNILKYDGLSTTLLKNDYSTTYFTTHDSQFDNIEGFLRANDFQNIISQTNYPILEVKTTLGVPDDYMFRYSIPILNQLSETKTPFFVTFMTASDHGPYFIPDYFEPKSDNIKHQITEYADWSLSQFISLSSKQKWFDNTIFVFVADHGEALYPNYDIALNYFHAPLMFYAPNIIKHNSINKNMASQIDLYPTLMGMLKIPYINNTLGIDLLNEKRKYAIINDDDKIGIIDTSYFCILKNNKTKLYQFKDNDKTDYSEQNIELVKEMTEYAKSNLQVYQSMKLKKETTLHNNIYDK